MLWVCVAILSRAFNENERKNGENEEMEQIIDINFGIGKVFVTESDIGYDTLLHNEHTNSKTAKPSLNGKKKGYNNVMIVSC